MGRQRFFSYHCNSSFFVFSILTSIPYFDVQVDADLRTFFFLNCNKLFFSYTQHSIKIVFIVLLLMDDIWFKKCSQSHPTVLPRRKFGCMENKCWMLQQSLEPLFNVPNTVLMLTYEVNTVFFSIIAYN